LQTVTVITADIIDSRQALDQVAKLPKALSTIHHDLLLTPFSLSRGDEIQAVCRGTLEAPELIRHLRYACFPLKLRVAVGLGEAEGEGEGERQAVTSWQMNGTAFLRARDAIDRLKKTRDTKTALSSGDPRLDLIANTILSLIDAIQDKWTKEQWDAVHAYEKAGTLAAAADILGVSYQSVQKRCKAAKWSTVEQAEKSLPAICKSIGYW